MARERMTIKLNKLLQDIDRACATRYWLIEGINDVKALQVQEQS
jgi:hypothetical protein